MNRIFRNCFIFLICCKISILSASATASYSWYCNRNSNNLKPPIPNEFSFINDYPVIWQNTARNDDDAQKVAYLTFDAGYENGNVGKILDVLKEKDVPGAFFILINLIESNPELVLRMAEEGHLVCNHTAHHKDMSKITDINLFAGEINLLSESFKRLTGKEISKYFRPPEGRFSALNLKHAGELGYTTVFWSFAYADWDNNNQPGRDFAIKKIMDNIHNGCVLLLHPTSATNAEILGVIIDQMRNEGYEFGTLDDLSKELTK